MKNLMIVLIKFYKKHISLFMEKAGVRCKFYPTCSEYALQALNKYGFLKGTWLSLKRILKCNPFSKGGYDPLK